MCLPCAIHVPRPAAVRPADQGVGERILRRFEEAQVTDPERRHQFEVAFRLQTTVPETVFADRHLDIHPVDILVWKLAAALLLRNNTSARRSSLLFGGHLEEPNLGSAALREFSAVVALAHIHNICNFAVESARWVECPLRHCFGVLVHCTCGPTVLESRRGSTGRVPCAVRVTACASGCCRFPSASPGC